MKGKTSKFVRHLCVDKRTKQYKDAKAELIRRSPRDPEARAALDRHGIDHPLSCGHQQTVQARRSAGIGEPKPKGTLHLKQRPEHGTVPANKIAEMRDTRAKATAKNRSAPRHR